MNECLDGWMDGKAPDSHGSSSSSISLFLLTFIPLSLLPRPSYLPIYGTPLQAFLPSFSLLLEMAPSYSQHLFSKLPCSNPALLSPWRSPEDQPLLATAVQCSVAPMMDYTDNHFRTLARLITCHTWLYTEMVVAETIVHQEENLDRFLQFPVSQHPIVLQLGGNNLSSLAKAARLASFYGYDEINLNSCGCPSEKVAGHGCFGARLMLDPLLVGHAMGAIAENSNVPVTVKCRIGVDDTDSYDQLCNFIHMVSSLSPTKHFIVHARKALLKGLSPAENRSVPPLKYEYVFALARDFPHLDFTLNGGITHIQEVKEALKKGAFGVMIGRAAYNSPWSTLGHVDNLVYGVPGPGLTRRQILEHYVEYADSVTGQNGPKRPSLRQLVKPLLHLFHSEPGAGLWRRAIDEQLRSCENFGDLLKNTLPVLHESVLDAPPPAYIADDQIPFSELPDFPEKPQILNPFVNSDSNMPLFLEEKLPLVGHA